MSKFWKTLLTVIITAAVCLLAFSIYFRVKIKPIITANELSSKIHAIDSVISEYGICDFDKQEAIDNAIRYYVYSLDDNYCDYFTVSDYQSFLESNAGNFTGIGVSVYTQAGKIENGLTIKRVLGNSPAEQANIKPMDTITGVDGESIIGIEYDEALDKIEEIIDGEIVCEEKPTVISKSPSSDKGALRDGRIKVIFDV